MQANGGVSYADKSGKRSWRDSAIHYTEQIKKINGRCRSEKACAWIVEQRDILAQHSY